MRFQSIQILRGIAALLIVLYHLIANTTNHLNYVCFGNFFNFGFVGVDFFFVLSGFIITYVHFRDLKNTSNISRFFKKRIIRVYPIYWVIAGVTLAIYLMSTPAYMRELGLEMDLTSPTIQMYLFKAFLLLPQEIPYLVGPTWTLSFELYFYAVFGLCIALGFKRSKLVFLIWLTLIVAYNLFVSDKNYYVNFLFHILILEFMMGCLVAYLVVQKANISNSILLMMAAVSVFLLYREITIDGLSYERNLWSVFLLGLFFAVITFSAAKIDISIPNIKYPAFLLLLGDASYSIYLSHNMFLSALSRFFAKVMDKFQVSINLHLIGIVITCVTVALGLAIHLLLEKRLLSFATQRYLTRISQKDFREKALIQGQE